MKYLRLLNDKLLMPAPYGNDLRFVVYPPRAFAHAELKDSIAIAGGGASRHFFGLEWRDVLEVAQAQEGRNGFLREVAQFLLGRGFEAFHGFRQLPLPTDTHGGRFYACRYFHSRFPVSEAFGLNPGGFYGR